eukprot:9126533-Pyramimonas_sp.AAC.1
MGAAALALRVHLLSRYPTHWSWAERGEDLTGGRYRVPSLPQIREVHACTLAELRRRRRHLADRVLLTQWQVGQGLLGSRHKLLGARRRGVLDCA